MLAADVCYGIRSGPGKESALRRLGLNQRIRGARAKRTLPELFGVAPDREAMATDL
jgi:hypothetical protein